MLSTTQLADRIGGLIWVVFGAAVVYGSWTMDRLPSLGIPLSTAPGVPTGLVGLGFIAFGMVMLLRRAPPQAISYSAASASPEPEAQPQDQGFAWGRALLSAALCLAYAGLLLGRGLPYWLLTAGFLFLHIVLLDETDRVPARPTLRRLLAAALIAPSVTVVVVLVFENLFLVRLP
ncbi:MAG: tripartite tricarboxylate transporter TctB family protein [Burkholderiales bacterium]